MDAATEQIQRGRRFRNRINFLAHNQRRKARLLPPAPVLTAMHLDLDPDPISPFRPIQFGGRVGRNALRSHVRSLHAAGVAHIAFNLRQSQREIEDVLGELAEHVIPEFAQENTMETAQ